MPRRTTRTVTGLVAVALVCVSALGLGACGGGGGGDDGKTNRGSAKGGGSIIVATSAAADDLDPARANSAVAWQALWNVYTPLLTYPHSAGIEGGKLIPGLARSLPQISADGKTYKLTLRKGLTYSDGTAVKASDFEHTIKRILKLHSAGLSLFTVIDGAEKYLDDDSAQADIPGIDADDKTGEITIRIRAPRSTFANVLALDYGGLVPGDTPFENQTPKPPPGVGPYKIENVDSRRNFDLVKVPGFAVEGLDPGKLDKITVTTVKNRRRATEDTVRNKIDLMIDPPAPDQVTAIREQYEGKRYKQFPINAAYYFFLNERIAPFDNKKVRQAVNHAVDRRAISRLAGGLVEPNCNFLPATIKGFRKMDPCPYEPPNLEEGKALVKQAGAEGAEVSVFGTDASETKAIVEYIADAMNRIGLKARPRTFEGSVYYDVVGDQKTRAQAGFSSYGQDFPNPNTFSFLVDGRSITETGNPNPGNIDDPEINKLIDRAGKSTNLDAVADDYAAIDRRLVEEAHIIPYGSRLLSAFASDRVDFDNCIVWHPVYNVDFTKLCLK
jgi:peptide/nickel transport system substrate-binding protein